ncbi:hypothetical protein CMI37_29940 [Candidatus Pacearchaeota archaeon]|nr:hypothetical protein [Candidatus Pacearchaeota archaeon]|tara:strand:+ start:266 stop:1300 length:1035 start_codon:yes stop_codon:yes gene_type:complete
MKKKEKTIIAGAAVIIGILVLALFLVLFSRSNINIISSSPDEIYTDSKESVFLIESNCLIEASYPTPYVHYYYESRLGIAMPAVDPNSNYEMMNYSIVLPSQGSGFKAEDRLFTNSHVVDCSNESVSDFLSGYYRDVNSTEFKGMTGIDIEEISDELWEKLKVHKKKVVRDKQEIVDGFANEVITFFNNHLQINEVYLDNISISNSLVSSGEPILVNIEKEGEAWPGKDFAILQTDDLKFMSVSNLDFGSSKNIRVGEKIFVMGYPARAEISSESRLESSITSGIVSAVKNSPDEELYFQIDAAASRGNSGGPVFDSDGDVVGLLTAGSGESFNFVFPSDSIPE